MAGEEVAFVDEFGLGDLDESALCALVDAPAAQAERAPPPRAQAPEVARVVAPSLAPAPAPAPAPARVDKMPFLEFKGRTLYARTEQEADAAAAALEHSLGEAVWPALGFDIEWRASFKSGQPNGPPATLQLATTTVAAVVQLSAIGRVPASLARLLGREDVLKVGVGAEDDARKLEREFVSRGLPIGGSEGGAGAGARSVAPAIKGIVDLCEFRSLVIAELADVPLALSAGSLRALCHALLGSDLRKGSVRTSNWEKTPLTPAQVAYAALDAVAGALCFDALAFRAPEAQPPVRAWRTHAAAALAPPAAAAPAQPLPPMALDLAQFEHVAPQPAAPAPPRLPPTKAEVHALFLSGRTLEEIALAKGIALGTAVGYLADAAEAGYAVDWARIALPPGTEEAVERALRAEAAATRPPLAPLAQAAAGLAVAAPAVAVCPAVEGNGVLAGLSALSSHKLTACAKRRLAELGQEVEYAHVRVAVARLAAASRPTAASAAAGGTGSDAPAASVVGRSLAARE